MRHISSALSNNLLWTNPMGSPWESNTHVQACICKPALYQLLHNTAHAPKRITGLKHNQTTLIAMYLRADDAYIAGEIYTL